MSAAKEGKAEATFNKIYQAFFKHSPYDDKVTFIDEHVVNSFIGKQGMLIVKTKQGNDGAYNVISDYLPCKKDLPLPAGFEIPTVEDLLPSIQDDGIPF